jgi:3-oxoacyl-[acyl-carrier-protein] synthase II
MQGLSTAGSGLPVAIAGVGAVSGLGWGTEPMWQGLRQARTAISSFQRFDHTRHRTHVAAEVPPPPAGFLAGLRQAGEDLRRLSLADLFALHAAQEALDGAGLPRRFLDGAGENVGVFFGSSTGGMWESEGFLAAWLAGRRRSARLGSLVSQQVNGPGDAVARHLRVQGPVATISSACASGALAIAAAFEAVRSGDVEIALAGGSDSLCELTYAGFNALRAVDEAPCRPFRAGRQGLSIGEGAAVLVLEPLARLLERGRQPLAVLAGAGSSCDAHHMTAPDPSGAGAAAALAAALADAGLGATEVDLINSHGTGTPLNDAAEWRALRQVFGERAAGIPLAATKALVGHLLGSAGAIEAVVTVLCLARGELHPAPAGKAAGADADADASAEIDRESAVALVLDLPLPLPEARVAASTSLAFGGANAALVFARWTGAGV